MKVVESGEVIYENPTLEHMRKYAKDNLELLWDEYKRSLNPEEYPVDLSQKCWDNKMRNIREVQEMVEDFIEWRRSVLSWRRYKRKSLRS